MAEQGLTLDRLRISLGGQTVVALDTAIAPGDVLTVMGPSGVGKSTLLAAISGTLDPAFDCCGHVVLNGRDITHLSVEARRVGILFQDELLFPHMSVGANLAFGLRPRLKGRAARREAVQTALRDMGMDGFADRDPATLSGGQRARVALWRTLLSEPEALLLDEAFSRLDTDRRARVRALVFEAARARGLPVLQVSHDTSDAEAAGGRIVTLG